MEKQKAYLRENFPDIGWETQRVLDGLERRNDFCLDVLWQVRMNAGPKGRVE